MCIRDRDIPIYVAMDSADAWAHPELFQLDQDNVPLAVAGCPPDGFSATGQLWGCLLYTSFALENKGGTGKCVQITCQHFCRF